MQAPFDLIYIGALSIYGDFAPRLVLVFRIPAVDNSVMIVPAIDAYF